MINVNEVIQKENTVFILQKNKTKSIVYLTSYFHIFLKMSLSSSFCKVPNCDALFMLLEAQSVFLLKLHQCSINYPVPFLKTNYFKDVLGNLAHLLAPNDKK